MVPGTVCPQQAAGSCETEPLRREFLSSQLALGFVSCVFTWRWVREALLSSMSTGIYGQGPSLGYPEYS